MTYFHEAVKIPYGRKIEATKFYECSAVNRNFSQGQYLADIPTYLAMPSRPSAVTTKHRASRRTRPAPGVTGNCGVPRWMGTALMITAPAVPLLHLIEAYSPSHQRQRLRRPLRVR